jgi:hypothetical protein
LAQSTFARLPYCVQYHESEPVFPARAQMPNIDRIKRQKRDKFDLLDRIHLAESPNVKRPTSPKSGAPIEPAIKFEVNLEADSFSKEKFVLLNNVRTRPLIRADTTSSFATSGKSTRILHQGGKNLPSNVSYAEG